MLGAPLNLEDLAWALVRNSLPKDEDLKKKVVEKMECHAKCGDDRECHHECHHGCPFKAVREKCHLNFQENQLLACCRGLLAK